MSRAPLARTVSPAAPHLPSVLCRAIRRALLRWYDRNRRDLPWRERPNDAYAQWVAEVMLQQTRVETVRPYYARFLKRFPNARKLADARHDTVLKHWEGLGYYRRALHLHRGAKVVRDRFGGSVPAIADKLETIPGIGRYTAAAIASIAFNEPVAAVDGNVARVLARLFAVADDVTAARGRATVETLAQQLLPAKRPGDFNQAWMDLGSLICTPKQPACQRCPLRSHCAYARSAKPPTLPRRDSTRRYAVPRIDLLAPIFVHRRRMLARRRPTGGLWSGLWEFPAEEINGCSDPRRRLRVMARRHGLRIVRPPEFVAAVDRRLTHRALTFHVFVCEAEPSRNGGRNDSCKWMTISSLARASFSAAHRVVFRTAEAKVRRLFQAGNAAASDRQAATG